MTAPWRKHSLAVYAPAAAFALSVSLPLAASPPADYETWAPAYGHTDASHLLLTQVFTFIDKSGFAPSHAFELEAIFYEPAFLPPLWPPGGPPLLISNLEDYYLDPEVSDSPKRRNIAVGLYHPKAYIEVGKEYTAIFSFHGPVHADCSPVRVQAQRLERQCEFKTPWCVGLLGEKPTHRLGGLRAPLKKGWLGGGQGDPSYTDNDGDGNSEDIDCNDNNPKLLGLCNCLIPPCQLGEVCDNAKDDDCDGKVDCDDELSCATEHPCCGKKDGKCCAKGKPCEDPSLVCDKPKYCKPPQDPCFDVVCKDDGNICNGPEYCKDGDCVSGPALKCAPDEQCYAKLGCACKHGSTEACYTGPIGTPGVGVCSKGLLFCENGVWSSCINEIVPAPEDCYDALDNDCDGVTDCTDQSCKGKPGCQGGSSTSSSSTSSASSTSTSSTSSSSSGGGQGGAGGAGGSGGSGGSGGAPAELCDGLDNDKDGEIDEIFLCKLGMKDDQGCKLPCGPTGYRLCEAPKCMWGQSCYPYPEQCGNSLDDDCNGKTDCDDPACPNADQDKDGWTCAQGDCDDGNPKFHPGKKEVCNGTDDNCNKLVDEGDPGGGEPCATGKVGACAKGTKHCKSGAVICTPEVLPALEKCDGLDNDCDGETDESDPNLGVPCSTSKSGICDPGTWQCATGSLKCLSDHQAQQEKCNGLDDDCDGKVDQGNPESGGGCTTGNLGVCAAGIDKCKGAKLVCDQLKFPSSEVCDGLDNDCDGQTDEDLGTTTCGKGVCKKAVANCVDGSLQQCVPGKAVAEVCADKLDNDCDGQTDEECGPCKPQAQEPCYDGPPNTQDVGACKAGLKTCNEQGKFGACQEQVMPIAEKCDGLDSDCDGKGEDIKLCGKVYLHFTAPPGKVGPFELHWEATVPGKGYVGCWENSCPSACPDGNPNDGTLDCVLPLPSGTTGFQFTVHQLNGFWWADMSCEPLGGCHKTNGTVTLTGPYGPIDYDFVLNPAGKQDNKEYYNGRVAVVP